MKRKEKALPFDPKAFLSKITEGHTVSDYRKDEIVYTQGQPADSVFYMHKGKAKITPGYSTTRRGNYRGEREPIAEKQLLAVSTQYSARRPYSYRLARLHSETSHR